MLIKESVLRNVIRQELIKEAINKDILSEAFLQNLGKKIGKKGNALLLFLASQAVTLNNAQAEGNDGGLAAARAKVEASEAQFRELKKAFQDHSSSLGDSEKDTQNVMDSINQEIEKIRKEAAKHKKNPFLILKKARNGKVDPRDHKQVFALLNYKKTVAAIAGKYTLLISQGDLSPSDIEKVGVYIKYISDSTFKGKFPNPESIIKYMEGQIGK